jgi:hypothetical protein
MKLFYQIVGFAILLLSCHPFKAANAFVVSRGGNVNSVPCSKTSPSTACYNVYSTGRSQRSQSQLNLLAPMPFVDTDTLHSIVTTASPSLVISETEPWVKPLSQVLGPFLNLFSFAMVRFASFATNKKSLFFQVFISIFFLYSHPSPYFLNWTHIVHRCGGNHSSHIL